MENRRKGERDGNLVFIQDKEVGKAMVRWGCEGGRDESGSTD